jgi:hypothetical protein
MKRPVLRRLICSAVCGFLFVASTSVAGAQPTKKHRLQLEAAACGLISFMPVPSSEGNVAISVQVSTLSALRKTGVRSLKEVVRDYEKAALAENTDAMIRALDVGVKVCHRLGLRTSG